MPVLRITSARLASSPLLMVLCLATIAPADEPPKANFLEHVAPIFQNRCNACHNADKAKGGLALDNYGAAMRGGGSGKVVEPGAPDDSHLWQLVTHNEQPHMPPEGPKIPDAELDLIKRWIEAGAPETSGSAVMVKAKPRFDFKPTAAPGAEVQGPPPLPEGVSTDPVVITARPNAVLGLATSPRGPLVAVAGTKQVLAYRTDTRRLAGVYPFPEGSIHVVRFSRDGSLLLAAGGRGGQSGRVVAWDVKTGKRVFEVGKEYDSVLAADLSPDHSMVALGGPARVVRVYNTADGELKYELRKHTEWITAVEFSPDGVLLASGDRNNGLVAWEAATGREFYDLRGHTGAITDLSWRPDSNILASASEDGGARFWEMENGTQVKAWGPNPGGVTSIRFNKDGRITTTGRDHVARLWGADGSGILGLEPLPDLATRAALTADGTTLVSADWSGQVRLNAANDGHLLGTFAANPPPLAARLASATALATAAQAEFAPRNAEFQVYQAAAKAKADANAAAQAVLAAAQQAAGQAATVADAATKQLAAAEAAARQAEASAKFNAEVARWEAALTTQSEHVLAESAAATQSAADTAAATHAPPDEALAARATAYRDATAQALEIHRAQAKAAAEAIPPAQAAVANAQAARAAATQALTDAQATLVTANAAVPPAQATANATAAEAAATAKVVADQTPAFQALAAKAAAHQADVEALTAETKFPAASP